MFNFLIFGTFGPLGQHFFSCGEGGSGCPSGDLCALCLFLSVSPSQPSEGHNKILAGWLWLALAGPVSFPNQLISFPNQLIDSLSKSNDFLSRSNDCVSQSIDFLPKSIDFLSKSIDFLSKPIDSLYNSDRQTDSVWLWLNVSG